MWWVVSTDGKTYFVVRANSYADVTHRYPNGTVVPYAFKDRKAAQAYAGKQNHVTGSAKPKKSKGKGTPGTGNNKPNGAYIVALARAWLGVPYKFGGTTRQGVDCSGLVYNVAHEAHIDNCPRTSEEQWAWCEHISMTEAGPGDLVFFVGAPEEAGAPGHVGIMVAPGQMIDAPFPGTVVRIDHFVQGEPVQNASNPNDIWGYGRLKGVAGSTSANPYIKSGGTVASAAGYTSATAGTMPVIFIAVAALVVIGLLLLLVGAGLLWKAR